MQKNNFIKKRIFFLVSAMQDGGAERVAALLCNAWIEEGHEVLLMPTFSGRGKCIYPLDSRVRLEFLADRIGTIRKTIWTKFQRFLATRNAIIDYAPDVVISFLPDVNIIAIISTTGTGIPVVVSERSYPPQDTLSLFWSIMRRIAYPRAMRVVAQTEIAKKWIQKHCPGSCVKVIPNPIKWPLPQSEPLVDPQTLIASNKKILLAVGRLHQEKGFDILLDTYAILANEFSDWNLVILGEGGKRKELEIKQKMLDLEGTVFMPGQVGNISDWYKRADLYVMTSHHEGFPNVLLEALAHGLPAVSFDCDAGPRDLIRHEVNGLLVPPEKGIEGLVAALQRLMRDGDLRGNMGAEALDVRRRFSITRIMKIWASVLTN